MEGCKADLNEPKILVIKDTLVREDLFIMSDILCKWQISVAYDENCCYYVDSHPKGSLLPVGMAGIKPAVPNIFDLIFLEKRVILVVSIRRVFVVIAQFIQLEIMVSRGPTVRVDLC